MVAQRELGLLVAALACGACNGDVFSDDAGTASAGGSMNAGGPGAAGSTMTSTDRDTGGNGNDSSGGSATAGGTSSTGGMTNTGGATIARLVAKTVAAGELHTCMSLSDGTVRCWGWNLDGQLGDGTVATSHLPVAVSGVTDAAAVTAGGVHSCALLGDGTVQCWGDTFGVLSGNPAEECAASQTYPCGVVPVTAPVTVSGISNAAVISAGYAHNCALLPGGTVQCWGRNSRGELGAPTAGGSQAPVTVSGISDAVSIAAGGHSCAARIDGTVRCWGNNSYGQLGNGSSGDYSFLPVAVSGITDAIMVATGATHSCALLAGGTVRCWGYNAWNQLGAGTSGDGDYRSVPVTVSDITDAIMIAAGDVHVCALLRDGTVKCWGYGYYGQLGNGTNPYRSGPVAVSGLANATAVTAGSEHTCAVLTGGTVQCWGDNSYGQLGDGTTTESFVPVTVVGF